MARLRFVRLLLFRIPDSLEDDEVFLRGMVQNFPIFGIIPILRKLLRGFEGIVSAVNVDHDVIRIGWCPRSIIVDFSRISAVVVGPFVVRQPGVNVIGRGDPCILWYQFEDAFRHLRPFVDPVTTSPIGSGCVIPETDRQRRKPQPETGA